MGLENFFKNATKALYASESLKVFYKNCMEQTDGMLFESQKSEDGTLTAKQFMDGIKVLSESKHTDKVFDVFAEDEHLVTNPRNAVVNEFGVFIRNVGNLVPENAVLEFAHHMTTNPAMRILAKKYPNEIMMQVYSMARFKCPDKGQGMQLLATLEDNVNKSFFPYVTARAEETHVAGFFRDVRKGISDDAAIARYRVSPSFQAVQGNKVFLDYLMKVDPVLSDAIDKNYSGDFQQEYPHP